MCSQEDLPHVEVFVKAAKSHRDEAAPSLIGQQWVMVLRALENKNLIKLTVTPTTMEDQPENYMKLNVARLLPAAWIESGCLGDENLAGLTISSTGSLETLMHRVGSRNLNPSINLAILQESEKQCETLFKDLMNYIRNDMKSSLLRRLNHLDEWLSTSTIGPFLVGDQLSYVDCQLMPKLQHIRVAGKAYKEFEIPHELLHLWAYIKMMYQLDEFCFACPSDRSMLTQYGEKDPLPKGIRPGLLGDGFTNTIPTDVEEALAAKFDSVPEISE